MLWYETEEANPGIVMGCDDDDDDGDGVIDSEDDMISFTVGEGAEMVDVTDAVLEDVVELKLNEIRTDAKIDAGHATIKVYAPGAAKKFGHVRLMKRTGSRLTYCLGNQDTFAIADLPFDTDETYYLQGVTPSVRARGAGGGGTQRLSSFFAAFRDRPDGEGMGRIAPWTGGGGGELGHYDRVLGIPR
jgi:hypothetical protein